MQPGLRVKLQFPVMNSIRADKTFGPPPLRKGMILMKRTLVRRRELEERRNGPSLNNPQAGVMMPIFFLAFMSLGCLRQESPPAAHPAVDGIAPAPSKVWRRFSTKGISFDVPVDLAQQDAFGIDSRVGALASDGMKLVFDFGFYSDDSLSGHFDGHTVKTGTVERVRVDGRAAFLATYSDNDWPESMTRAVEIYVPRVERSWFASHVTKLQLKIAYCDETDTETARTIALSVKFDG